MRLVVALAAVATLASAGAGWAAPCIARAHRGAVPYDIDETNGTRLPADTSQGAGVAGPDDAEVAGVERDAHGQVWVYRVHEFAWRRQDVDLRGDCRHVGP